MRTRSLIPVVCGSMMLAGCVQMQQVGLYPQSAPPETLPHIYNFYALSIFEDHLSAEQWYTPNTDCIQITPVDSGQYSGSGALQIIWNKPQSSCDWIGLGFGWDDWFAKDLHAIMDSASLEFYVRNLKGITNGLPWALALEDYGNAQAWAGMTPNYIENGRVTEEWTKVTIPLNAFDITVQQPDLFTIKQLIIQFEGEGAIMIDQIRIVPGTNSGKKTAIAYPALSTITIDGQASETEWQLPVLHTEQATLGITFDAQNLYLCAQVTDAHPVVNTRTGDQIWNGDAIELAFSTNPEAGKYRKKYLLSDKHIGIRVSDTPEIYDWSMNTPITEHQTRIRRTANGYVLESSIPWTALQCQPWKTGMTYGIEVGIDNGDKSGNRISQTRWNNNYTEGFHENPSMWGLLKIQPAKEIIK